MTATNIFYNFVGFRYSPLKTTMWHSCSSSSYTPSRKYVRQIWHYFKQYNKEIYPNVGKTNVALGEQDCGKDQCSFR